MASAALPACASPHADRRFGFNRYGDLQACPAPESPRTLHLPQGRKKINSGKTISIKVLFTEKIFYIEEYQSVKSFL